MRDFSYHRASSVDEAIDLVASGATPIAGGTELLNWMRLGADQSDNVVDIGRLKALQDITLSSGVLRIGALSTLSQVENDRHVREHAPVLAEACLKSASAQIRNSATLGGNVLQKTRCPYFRVEAGNESRMPWKCNKRAPGSGCSATAGHYDRASIFGVTDACICNHPSDPAAALAALDATVHAVGPNGPRDIPMSELHLTQAEARALIDSRKAGDFSAAAVEGTKHAEALIVNRLAPSEIIIAYSFTPDAAAGNSRYLKVRERESYEYAMVSAAVCLEMHGGTIKTIRIAMGSIAQKPWRLFDAEKALEGKALSDEELTPALDEAFMTARPVESQKYKIKLARNAARRTILMAGGKFDG